MGFNSGFKGLSEPRYWFERSGEDKGPLSLHAVKPRFISPSNPSLITTPTELSLAPASELSLETGVFRCLWYYTDVREVSGIVLRVRQPLFPSIFFPVNYAIIIIPTFSCVKSEV